jgi:serine/threonine-protein kinase
MLQPGANVGRYLVRRKLAEGGMAEIFLASALGAEGFSKDVVLKVIRGFLSSDPVFVEMFVAEARLASQLNHPNIVQVFDFGTHEGEHFIAMEFIRGTSLSELRKRAIQRGERMPPEVAAEIAAQVARALSYAHELSVEGRALGIVHRDVTPQNVLLSFDGAVKLSDFGIAKASSSHTTPGMLKGKFAYMAPEQSRGEPVDARTDVFSLGIVLWEMLTGGQLFCGDSDVAVIRSVQQSHIAPPARLNIDTPQELSDIVMTALARQPEQRYQTAAALERALVSFLRGSAKSIDDISLAGFIGRVLGSEDLLAERRPAGTVGQGRGPERGTDDDVPLGHAATLVLGPHSKRARTEQMPAPRPRSPSRPFFPPVRPEEAESRLVPSSLVTAVRGSASQSPSGARAPKAKHLVALMSLVLLGAVVTVAGMWTYSRSGGEPNQAQVLQRGSASAAVSTPEPAPEPAPERAPEPAPDLSSPSPSSAPTPPSQALQTPEGPETPLAEPKPEKRNPRRKAKSPLLPLDENPDHL